jgi:rhamnosyltransferase
MADISFVVRSNNSSKTIWQCLKAVRNQIIPAGLEAETIVVDNESNDDTVEKAKKLSKYVVGFTEARPTGIYTPGAALNVGCELASGDLIIILSSHCVPADRHLVEAYFNTMVEYKRRFSDVMRMPMDLAGMYARQVPHKSLSDHEKVEIYTVFGNEWQGQSQDAFFHNGCSCVLKSAWKITPFNEKLETLEDREWAYRIQQFQGGKLMYVPNALVTRHKPLFHKEHSKEALEVIEGTLQPLEIKEVKGEA